MIHPTFSLLSRLWLNISKRRRRQFSLLLFLMILASFAEIISIGSVLPFLSVLTDQARLFEHPSSRFIIQFFGIVEPKQLLLPLSLVFASVVAFTGAARLLLIWATTRLSFAAGSDLSKNIYRRSLYQPYAVHVSRNSSEIIDGISAKSGSAIQVINMMLTIISSATLIIAILIALLSVDVVIALLTFSGFGLIYIFIIKLARNRLIANGQVVAKESKSVIKALQEGLGGIRDVLIDRSQEVYCQIYSKSEVPMRRALGNNFFIASSPRPFMEALGTILIIFLAYWLAKQPDGMTKALPILGALALGAQRLVPVMQQAYSSWSGILSHQASLKDALDLLEQPTLETFDESFVKVLPFQKNISLKQISFRYNPQSPWVLKKVDLSINKGDRIGIIGKTGSGKSTLLDILMGLLSPTSGTLEIDGVTINQENHRSWQKHIAHVPQLIFLADSSIEENIALGMPKDQIDRDRVKKAAQQAQISDTIESWPKQYQTLVGERGIRLSGGQRQRIAIARALYKKADVIFFDEATSALDSETEVSVMHAIEGLQVDITIFVIAHRITTLKNCNIILELGDGGIKRSCSYRELVE